MRAAALDDAERPAPIDLGQVALPVARCIAVAQVCDLIHLICRRQLKT
jgi:hypothetical protein